MRKEILYRFFERNASSAEKEEIRQWLETSPENKKTFYREREFYVAMIFSNNPAIDQEKSGYPVSRPFYKGFIREFIKIAAVVLLTITISFYFQRQEDINRELLTINVPSGQRTNLLLPDGTNIWLNARTQLRYPGVFDGQKREIYLDGEAYLEVTHKTDKPFIVHTNKCAIEVLGTKFNVEDYSDSKDFSTALMEGAVRISDNLHQSDEITLSPDHLATFIDGKLTISKIADYDYYRWREGLVCFKDLGFEELMHRFEKCYGIRIMIENEKLLEYGFTGKFRISDGIDNALRVLQKDAPYTFKRNEEENVIYIK